MAEFITLLDQLLPRFRRLDVTASTATHTLHLADSLHSAAEEDSLEQCDAAGLEGRMVDLCQALVDWAPQAVEALPALLAALDVRPPSLMQFSAGCYSLSAVATMAGRLGVQPSAAFRIASACQLMFDLGRRCTVILTASAEAGAAAGQPSSGTELGMLTSVVAMQLEAVVNCEQLLQPQPYPQAQVAAAFARSTARPAVLVGWLREVARAVVVLRSELEESTVPGSTLVRCYTAMLAKLAMPTFYEEHATAVAADAALQDAIVSGLLGSCLPHLVTSFAAAAAGGLPADTHHNASLLFCIPTVLQQPALSTAVPRYMRTQSAAATVRHVAALVAAVAALPADLPAGLAIHTLSRDTFLGMHLHAAELLALCCSSLSPPEPAAAGSNNGSGTDGSSGDAAADVTLGQLTAAWELVAAVPHIASAVRCLVAGAADDLGSLRAQAQVASLYRDSVGQLLLMMGNLPCTAAHLASRAAAAEASLRLLPLLMQLGAALQQLPADSLRQADRNAPGRLAARLINTLWYQVPQPMLEGAAGSGAAEQPTPAALRRQLLQAHLAGCWLAHWLAQRAAEGGSIELAGGGMPLRQMLLKLLLGLCHVLLRVLILEGSNASLRSGVALSQRQAPYLAHMEAAVVLTRLAETTGSAGTNTSNTYLDVNLVVTALSGCLGTAVQEIPDLADPAVLEPLELLLPDRLQDAAVARSLATVVCTLVNVLALRGPWAVALASSRLLTAGLDAVALLSSSDQASDAEQVGRTVERVDAVITALDDAVVAALQHRAAIDLPADLAARLDETAESLQEQWRAGLSGLPAEPSPAESAALLRQLLPRAADLAALMQQYYALPAAVEPRRLALAQAAAGRCCAYLRCSNVEGEGGPAAGKGAGSKRCRACRAVWYCGMDCLRANWREGGHKHVCTALGEARQAAKEAQRAAGAEAAAAGQE